MLLSSLTFSGRVEYFVKKRNKIDHFCGDTVLASSNFNNQKICGWKIVPNTKIFYFISVGVYQPQQTSLDWF